MSIDKAQKSFLNFMLPMGATEWDVYWQGYQDATLDLQRQLAAIAEDYKDLEAQLMAVGAGGVSKLMGDTE